MPWHIWDIHIIWFHHVISYLSTLVTVKDMSFLWVYSSFLLIYINKTEFLCVRILTGRKV